MKMTLPPQPSGAFRKKLTASLLIASLIAAPCLNASSATAVVTSSNAATEAASNAVTAAEAAVAQVPEPPAVPEIPAIPNPEFLNASEMTKNLALLIPIFGIIVPFATLGLVIWLFFLFRHRRQQMLHETIRSMVDKGVPIPPELFGKRRTADPFKEAFPPSSIPRYQDGRTGDLRRGVFLILVGIGVWVMMGKIGVVCILVGVGYLISGFMTKPDDKNNNISSNLPPGNQ